MRSNAVTVITSKSKKQCGLSYLLFYVFIFLRDSVKLSQNELKVAMDFAV